MHRRTRRSLLLLIPTLVTAMLAAAAAADVNEAGDQEVPVLDLYVMPHCPWALRAEQEIVTFVSRHPEAARLAVHYMAFSIGAQEPPGDNPDSSPGTTLVSRAGPGCQGPSPGAPAAGNSYRGFTSPGGRAEIEEAMRQLVIREFYPEAHLDYLLSRASDIGGPWQLSASDLGIDPEIVEEMVAAGTGGILLAENIAAATRDDVRSSPTLFIDGELYRGPITAGSLALLLRVPDYADGAGIGTTGEERGDHRLENMGLANPAAVYCHKMDGTYRISEEAGRPGICTLPDGRECDSWDFLAGRCGREYSWCARNGWETRTDDDGHDPFSREYAVCVDRSGRAVGSVTGLSGLSEKATRAVVPGGERERRRVEPPGPHSSPPAFDWRDLDGVNWITPVQNQGGCGSCWGFAAVGVVEAMFNIDAGDPDLDMDLSEQYLVSDCHFGSMAHQNCCGGSTWKALRFIMNSGIPDEGCMWYVDGFGCSCPNGCGLHCTYHDGFFCSDRTCSDRCDDWEERIVRTRVTADAADVKESISGNGPVTSGIGMGGGFGGYWDGDIYRCTNDDGGNHAIVLVGYDDAGEYWIAKNSWGSSWGDDGFFKVGYGECYTAIDVHTVETTACGDTIREDRVLFHDLSSPGGDALVVSSDSVTLDCNGHRITGAGGGTGILLDGVTGVRIENCTVEGFNRGIAIEGGGDTEVTGNTLSGNTGSGIHLLDTSGNTIWNNTLGENGDNAYEEESAAANLWDHEHTGNTWSDFRANPGYPFRYEIPGPGDGVDRYPAGRTPRHREAEDLFPVGIDGETGPDGSLPKEFALSQNFPNPFNPVTTITFDVPGGAGDVQPVLLSIYDVRGRLVRTLVDDAFGPGAHRVVWNGTDSEGRPVPSGIYVSVLRGGAVTTSRKMTVLR